MWRGRCISSGRFPPSSLMVTRKLFECSRSSQISSRRQVRSQMFQKLQLDQLDAFGHLLGKSIRDSHKIIDIYWVFQFLPPKSQAHFNGFLIFDFPGAILCHSGERFSRTRKQGGRSLTATTWHELTDVQHIVQHPGWKAEMMRFAPLVEHRNHAEQSGFQRQPWTIADPRTAAAKRRINSWSLEYCERCTMRVQIHVWWCL